MNARMMLRAMAVSALLACNAASAADSTDTWQPGIYFKMDFGGQAKTYEPHFGAQLTLSPASLENLSGGGRSSTIQCVIKGECAHGRTDKLPAYMSMDFNPGKVFAAQWLGADLYRFDYTRGIASSRMLNFGPFNEADSFVIKVTGGMIAGALLGYGISQWTSDSPAPPPPKDL